MDNIATEKIVAMTWIDASGPDGWVDRDNLDYEIQTILSIGFLLHEDDTSMTISPSLGRHHVHAPMTIPKKAVVERKDIGEELAP